MSTNMRLSANQWTTAKLYDGDHPQQNLHECLAKEEYLQCWRQISTCGLPVTREESANGEMPFWEDCQAALNKQFREITIEGRTGRQSYVVDDHKAHCETSPSNHRDMNVKFFKHVADNRWGMVVDTLVCTTTLLVANLQVAIKGCKSHNSLKNLLYASAFGRDPFTPPDLGLIEFHGDRGYFSENSFASILLPTGSAMTCTCPKGIWLPFSLR